MSRVDDSMELMLVETGEFFYGEDGRMTPSEGYVDTAGSQDSTGKYDVVSMEFEKDEPQAFPAPAVTPALEVPSSSQALELASSSVVEAVGHTKGQRRFARGFKSVLRSLVTPRSIDYDTHHSEGPSAEHIVSVELAALGRGVPVSDLVPFSPPTGLSMEQQEAEANNQLNIHFDLLRKAKTEGGTRLCMFGEEELRVPLIGKITDEILSLADDYLKAKTRLGNLGQLGLPATELASGHELIASISNGQLSGTSGLIRQHLNSVLEETKQEVLPATFSKKHSQNLLDYLSEDTCWDTLAKALTRASSDCAYRAHKKFFANVRQEPDSSFLHLPEGSSESRRMQVDFDNLIEALGLPKHLAGSQADGDGNTVNNLYLSMEDGGRDGLDMIMEKAGQNIRSYDSLGGSAFAALIMTRSYDPKEGCWLVMGYQPQVPGYETADDTSDSDNTSKYNLHNVRPMKAMKTPYITMPISVWELTSDGYLMVIEQINSTGYPFVDFRGTLRDSQRQVRRDIAVRRRGMQQIALSRQEALSEYDRKMAVVSACSIPEIGRLLAHSQDFPPPANAIEVASTSVTTALPITAPRQLPPPPPPGAQYFATESLPALRPQSDLPAPQMPTSYDNAGASEPAAPDLTSVFDLGMAQDQLSSVYPGAFGP